MSQETRFTVPSFPQSWYLVCRAADVPPGRVLSRELFGKPIVIFRGQDRNKAAIYALSAHCAHMGTHLGKGIVVEDRLRCPLHHWEYNGKGTCCHIPGVDTIPKQACQVAYPVVEHYGGVFIFNGPIPLFPPPSFSTVSKNELRLGHGQPVHLRCPWFALAANGFDMQHLQTVHARALREPPSIKTQDQYRLQLCYVSRVTGDAISDRIMRWLSRDRIKVTITCWGGSVITVESDLDRTRSMLLLSLLPVESGTEVIPIFGVRRTGITAMDNFRVAVARWLFSKFLQRDMAILEGMNFFPNLTAEDKMIRVYLEFLSNLPSK
jgi:phenylpropionate dioxygenase-like ring-hydroxylating dioxygenase large terminal subunit